MRGQTSLPVLGVALVLLLVGMLFALTVADGQLSTADSDALERQTAAGVAERLVAADTPATARANVISPGSLSTLSVADLRDRFGLGEEGAVRVTLAGSDYVATGDAAGGTTVERVVLVETRTAESLQPRFAGTRSATLPRRTENVTVDLSGATGATIHTVTANGAVVLHDPAGLSGSYTVDVPRYETATLRFLGPGSLSDGDVDLEYWPAQTRKAVLRVTVDRWGDPSD